MTFDRSKWDKVTLGDIARSLTIAIKNPFAEGFDKFVGLEHIEPGNIHIKSWGNVSDGTTFTRVFRKGQVLFGKRRAYQKKAALAEFDGVCSGDILVCEAIEDAVLPELLPFIVQSDRFFEYAIKTSAGSLSPRTKFKDLAKFSLRLPKLEKQKSIADLLWSIDETIEGWVNVLNQTEILIQSRLKEKLKSYHVNEIKIKEVLGKTSEFKVGKVPQAEYLNDGKYPVIDQSKAVVAGYSDKEELVYSGELPVLVFGDHTTEIKYIESPFILGADGTKVIRPNPIIKARYLFYAIRNLNLKPVGYRRHFAILKDSKIKVPDIDQQDDCVKELDYLLNKKALIERYISSLNNILKEAINQVFM